MAPPRILIAGIGNIFLGDDAFGVEVARRLAERPLPEGVRVVDFGIRGFDLTFALLDDLRRRDPGRCRAARRAARHALRDRARIWGDASSPASHATIDAHGMDPVKVLRLAAVLGQTPPTHACWSAASPQPSAPNTTP